MGSGELINGLCRVRDSFNSYTLDRLAMAGAAAAVNDSPYYDGINRKVIATRRRVSEGLVAMGFRVLPSQANFIFAAPPAYGKGTHEFFASLRERGFLVRYFNKPRIADFLRISIGTDEDMDAFLEACREIIRK
jgi:histidinol-phosphate aminotransferase